MSSHNTPDQSAVRRPDTTECHRAMVVHSERCFARRISRLFGPLLFCVFPAVHGQVSQPANQPATPEKRAFGVIPNYRTVNGSAPFQAITARQKMAIAAQDSFDWGTVAVSAAYAGFGQFLNRNPSFGQGSVGYGNRLVRIYADFTIGNVLTEGAMPSLLREDPRYFRRGQGTFWRRMGYATSRIFVTRTDSGGSRFNVSEVLGNAMAAGISNAYYPSDRTARANLGKVSIQLGSDAFSNIVKEFWPDAKQKLFGHHRNGQP
jgi:hypothetical protein